MGLCAVRDTVGAHSISATQGACSQCVNDAWHHSHRNRRSRMGRTSSVGMRLLKVYVFAAASLLIVFTLSAFQNQAQRTRFEVIDVERMNIVEKDGKVRIVLSNKARFPGLMVKGEENPYPRDVAGIAFINEDGTEYGTLT